jgi:hypothetical protein
MNDALYEYMIMTYQRTFNNSLQYRLYWQPAVKVYTIINCSFMKITAAREKKQLYLNAEANHFADVTKSLSSTTTPTCIYFNHGKTL